MNEDVLESSAEREYRIARYLGITGSDMGVTADNVVEGELIFYDENNQDQPREGDVLDPHDAQIEQAQRKVGHKQAREAAEPSNETLDYDVTRLTAIFRKHLCPDLSDPTPFVYRKTVAVPDSGPKKIEP